MLTIQQRKMIIEFLKENAFKNSFNGKDDSCGQLFAGTIKYASMVFISHLYLGGSYTINEEDKNKMKDLLCEVNKIIDKYQINELYEAENI